MSENRPKFGPEQYAAGRDIIRQGDEPDRFYLITRGSVDVVYQPPDGLDELIDTLGPGDYFGEVGMVRRSRRMATVRAASQVDVMVMDNQTFHSWMNSSPEIAAEIETVIRQRLAKSANLPELLPEEPSALRATGLESDVLMSAVPARESLQTFKEGETIIRQGETADKFYVIIEGFVTVSHRADDGREQTVKHLTSGDYFGEIGMLEGSPRIASVTALTDLKALSFDRETFRNWMIRSPSSQDELQREATRRRKDTGQLTLPDDSPST